MPTCARCGQPFPGENSPDVICANCAGGMLKESEIPELESTLKEGEDYYFNASGFMVMTAEYLKRRGYCCENGCYHCPYAT